MLTVLTYLLTDEAAPSARDDNLTSTAYSSSSEAISEQRACSEASLLKRA